MKRTTIRVLAATVACLSTHAALGQDAGGSSTVAPQGTTSPPVQATPPPANPPAVTTTPATPSTATQAPAAGAPAGTATPPAAVNSGAAAPAATTNGTQLPEVKVIQEQPKQKAPEPPPVEEAQPKPKKKPAPVVEAEPEPAPAPKKVAKPKQVQNVAKKVQPQPTPEPAPVAEAAPAAPLATEVKMSPIGGSEIPIAKVPGGVTTVSSQDLGRDGGVKIQDALQQRVPGVVVSDVQGNEFQTNIQYRGFEVSPVNGVPQGLAIYQNGVRVNEVFGDIVNWDFIPEIAINDLAVMSGNPVFGLNAIGGAISLSMKDGFNYHGTEFDFRAGSFGRYQGSMQTGQQSGAVAAYLALEGIHDDGWREFSPTEVKRMYADLGFKGDSSEFHVNFTGAKNSYGVTAAAPVELLATDWSRAFTSPQTTDNEMKMVSVNGKVEATPTTTLSGVAYYRSFQQKHADGNISEAAECDGTDPTGTAGHLCLNDGAGEPLVDTAGIPVPTVAPDGEVGSIDKTSQNAQSYGASVQAVDKSKLFELGNQFLIGSSYDHGNVKYQSSSEIGSFLPHFVVAGSGITLGGPDVGGPVDVAPRNINTTNDYYGLYFSDTLDLTDQLALTVGGRYNYANIKLADRTGNFPELNTSNTFERFNPAAGLTYKFTPGISVYGGYSEANRAPTPSELACADETKPCVVESFLTADPPLKQVVSHTWEVGLRGEDTSWSGRERLTWRELAPLVWTDFPL